MSRSEQIKDRLIECIHNGELENSDLVKIFEHIRDILNLQTIESYRKSKINPKTNKPYSYNWMKSIIVLQTEIQGKKYYVDND